MIVFLKNLKIEKLLVISFNLLKLRSIIPKLHSDFPNIKAKNHKRIQRYIDGLISKGIIIYFTRNYNTFLFHCIKHKQNSLYKLMQHR